MNHRRQGISKSEFVQHVQAQIDFLAEQGCCQSGLMSPAEINEVHECYQRGVSVDAAAAAVRHAVIA